MYFCKKYERIIMISEIRIEDYKNVSTPFIQEVIDTGIKVA